MIADVNGRSMHYRVEGEGPALLLLHAFPLSGDMWAPQVEGLKDVARIIVPDLRGFGKSAAAFGFYTLDDMAADVLALLDRLNVDRADVCGLSMGGYLAFALLRRAGERVRGLILADTKAGPDTEEARDNRYAMASEAEREGSGPIAEGMAGKLLGKTSLGTNPALVERVKEIIRANTGTGIAGAQRAMAARPDSTPLLADLEIPTLVLVGEEDAITPPGEAETMASLLPRGRCAVLPRAGHLSNLENPEDFNARIREFLRSLEE